MRVSFGEEGVIIRTNGRVGDSDSDVFLSGDSEIKKRTRSPLLFGTSQRWQRQKFSPTRPKLTSENTTQYQQLRVKFIAEYLHKCRCSYQAKIHLF